MYLLIKRGLDILLSIGALIILLPLFLILILVIKMDSAGPVFFLQGRLGRDGKKFQMIKFRSMIENAETIGTGLFNYENDPRVTRVGRFLRNTSLDELPQLINVIKGDMAIVGPRPSVTYELGDYETLNRRYKKRFSVLPGITGLAQVSGRNEIPWDEKVEYDNRYVDLLKRNGPIIDFKIICKTIAVVFSAGDICEQKMTTDIEDEVAANFAAQEVIRKAHEKDEG